SCALAFPVATEHATTRPPAISSNRRNMSVSLIYDQDSPYRQRHGPRIIVFAHCASAQPLQAVAQFGTRRFKPLAPDFELVAIQVKQVILLGGGKRQRRRGILL